MNRLRLEKVRPRRWPSRVVGLTGSIAMGKSTAANFLARAHIPVFSADAAVHKLLASGGLAVEPVGKHFPGTRSKAGIDRGALGKAVFGKPVALAALENILHPMVKAMRLRFFHAAALKRRAVVAVEIPLLFETPRSDILDMILVVSAPVFLQRQRALSRPGMTSARLGAILARQMPDSKKRRLADTVIPSGLGKRETLRRLTRSLKMRLG